MINFILYKFFLDCNKYYYEILDFYFPIPPVFLGKMIINLNPHGKLFKSRIFEKT